VFLSKLVCHCLQLLEASTTSRSSRDTLGNRELRWVGYACLVRISDDVAIGYFLLVPALEINKGLPLLVYHLNWKAESLLSLLYLPAS
jgi:hypothetical protein